jgi:hypothetical protein
MRDIVYEAIGQAREIMDGVSRDMKADNQLTMDEQLKRYKALHRGNPANMARFVARNAPAGRNPLDAMREYEQSMESAGRKRGMWD